MRCRGAKVLSSTCPARTEVSSSSSREKSGTRFNTSGVHAMESPRRNRDCAQCTRARFGKRGSDERIKLMHVRTLRGIATAGGRLFHHFNVKAHGHSLWRIAGGIVAGLVAKDSMHHILSRHNREQGMHGQANGEISGVNVQ